jgi:hypothetical protein
VAIPATGVTSTSLIDKGSLNSMISQSVELPGVQRNAPRKEIRFARAVRW